jgi:hypothetical protein
MFNSNYKTVITFLRTLFALGNILGKKNLRKVKMAVLFYPGGSSTAKNRQNRTKLPE